MMRYVIMVGGGVGGFLFVCLWMLTFIRPDFVAQTLRYMINTALHEEIDRRVDALPALVAKRIAATPEQRRHLKARLQESVDNVMAHRIVPV
ncbi:hypothetical protein GIX45_20975 [Erwinia sp. CPCC 100877]|nr:hypothetical protein [Erwinia sp. CPCC 100877]